MNRWIGIIAVLALAAPAWAHRLDEYLQATRIGVGLEHVELNIDLTPGVAIVQELLPFIDPDGNGHISTSERDAYAQKVIRDLHLELDGQHAQIKLRSLNCPPLAEMTAGEGVVRLRTIAKVSKLKPGHHQILFRNNHLPAISVYLVNALVPASKRIEITRQVRDEAQREYRLDFDVTPLPSP